MTDAEKIKLAISTLKLLRSTGGQVNLNMLLIHDTLVDLETESTELPTQQKEYKRLLEKLQNQAEGIEQYQAELAKVSHLLAPLEGWKLVPKTANYRMRQAAKAFQGCNARVLYEVMVENSPQPRMKES